MKTVHVLIHQFTWEGQERVGAFAAWDKEALEEFAKAHSGHKISLHEIVLPETVEDEK